MELVPVLYGSVINPCLCLNYNGKTNYSKLLRDKLCNIEIWREEVLAASETMLTQLKLLAVWLIFITAGANAMASVTAPKAGHHDTFQTLCEIFRDQGVWPIPPDEALGAAGIYKSNQSTWIGCYSHQQLVCWLDIHCHWFTIHTQISVRTMVPL